MNVNLSKQIQKGFFIFIVTFLSACSNTVQVSVPSPTVTTQGIALPQLTATNSEPTKNETSTLVTTPSLQSGKLYTPTTSPAESLPPLSIPLILDRREAITYSFNLLVYRGLEQGYDYDNADYVQVRFPDGDRGVFITMSFIGIDRGYQFLYRIRDDRVELVDLVTGGPFWGIKSLQGEEERVEIEFFALSSKGKAQAEQWLKVTGAKHKGTGLWTDGYFQIIAVTDKGIRVIFADAERELNYNHRGYDNQYRYEYKDMDSDGMKEIIKEGEQCTLLLGEQEGLEKDDCLGVREIYQFNGQEYIID